MRAAHCDADETSSPSCPGARSRCRRERDPDPVALRPAAVETTETRSRLRRALASGLAGDAVEIPVLSCSAPRGCRWRERDLVPVVRGRHACVGLRPDHARGRSCACAGELRVPRRGTGCGPAL